jgi:hypothetical protein
MKKPTNIDDYDECLQMFPDRTIIFCVECDQWRPVEVSLLAIVRVTHNKIKSIESNDESAKFFCSRCKADVDYLVKGKESAVLGNIRQYGNW